MTLRVATLADRRWTLLAGQRFRTTVVGVFASAAFALALVGLVGVISYNVAQRRKELALRVVLGARHRDIAVVTLQHAIVPVAVGVVVGLAGAVMLSNVLESLLVDGGRPSRRVSHPAYARRARREFPPGPCCLSVYRQTAYRSPSTACRQANGRR